MEERYERLIAEYRLALLKQLERQDHLVITKSQAEYEKAEVLATATIDGKNADTRKRQTAEALGNDPSYQEALARVTDGEHSMALASIDVKAAQERLSLTKAWLYSQSGIGS